MQKIRRKDFLNQIQKTDYSKNTARELDELFDFLDHNKTGFISLNEFRYYFYEREFLEKEVKESALNSVLEDDLRELFRRIDVDDSGYMDVDEFVTCLNLLGFVVTPEVIQYEFDQIDKNNDRKIDYDEFKFLMRTKLRRDFLKIENKIKEIKENLKAIHP